jgi:hypothetical protein
LSVIKKLLPVLVVILAIPSIAMACFDSGSSSALQGQTKIEVKTVETTAEAQETVAESKVNGIMYETDKFSILQPDGWKATEVSGGVVFEKSTDAMQLSVGAEPPNYTEDIPDAATFCKKQVEFMAKSLNGTAPEEITMFGIKFFKTSYSLDGRDQTIFYGDRNSDIVIMAMAGKDHQNNVEIKAMLESIKFK